MNILAVYKYFHHLLCTVAVNRTSVYYNNCLLLVHVECNNEEESIFL